MANEANSVAKDMVVSLAYKLIVDGEVLDEASDKDAILFIHGHRNIIPGLEKELIGMKIGETKSVKVAPKDGYGDKDQKAIEELALDEFPKNVKPKVGLELEMPGDDGHGSYARVVSVGEKSAQLDFNHPLAGKELNFEVKVVELRPATSEELSHGHVHGPGGHH
ncbi:MAG: peptidylprolyl isomerase [Chloroflexi bacterium]|nr:peptidylprolyl isomerase [Chloroflexota bacterium]MQC26377.1 peptidylprolyl isomerase [Chloroflexota bacterium]